MGYLTPDTTPDKATCRALFIPDSEQYLAIVRGALQELTFPYNWDKFGALTPEQAAENFVDMFDRFCFNIGVCRVVGEIIAFAGSTTPDDRWLVCDGSEYDADEYSDLFAVIGTIYGSTGSGLFKVPDLRGRALSGVGTGSGLTEVVIGQEYGEESHILTVGELAVHSHAYAPVIIGDLDVESVGLPQPNAAQIVPVVTENTYDTGNNDPHNTIGPRLGITYLIVARD